MKESLIRDQSKLDIMIVRWIADTELPGSAINSLLIALAGATTSRPSGSLLFLFLPAIGFGVGHVTAINASAGTREQSLSNCLFSPSLDAPVPEGPVQAIRLLPRLLTALRREFALSRLQGQ